MIPIKLYRFFLVTLGLVVLLCAPNFTQAQQSQVMGELKFLGTLAELRNQVAAQHTSLEDLYLQITARAETPRDAAPA